MEKGRTAVRITILYSNRHDAQLARDKLINICADDLEIDQAFDAIPTKQRDIVVLGGDDGPIVAKRVRYRKPKHSLEKVPCFAVESDQDWKEYCFLTGKVFLHLEDAEEPEDSGRKRDLSDTLLDMGIPRPVALKCTMWRKRLRSV